MKWIIAAVGRLKDPFYRTGSAKYLERLQHYRPVCLIEVPEAIIRPTQSAAALCEESVRIRRAIRPAQIVVLTERGESLTTAELAARLMAEEATGRDLAFVIGGPNGIAPALEREASWQLALSSLTLPYQLARLVLLEQLYRIETLRRGEPYHRAGNQLADEIVNGVTRRRRASR